MNRGIKVILNTKITWQDVIIGMALSFCCGAVIAAAIIGIITEFGVGK